MTEERPIETEWWVIAPCCTEEGANKIREDIKTKTGYDCYAPREVAK